MNKKVAYIVPDTEFTSFDMIGGDLISLGAVELLEDYTIGREFQCFLKPRSSKYFTDGAQEVHGISYFKALSFPERRESMLAYLQWLSPLQDQFQIPVAYYGSWNFDYKWIETTMNDVDLSTSFQKAHPTSKESHFNIMKLARQKLKHIQDNWVPNKKGEMINSKYTLSNVAKFYNLEHDHHDSLSDARVSAQILGNLLKEVNTWTGELI